MKCATFNPLTRRGAINLLFYWVTLSFSRSTFLLSSLDGCYRDSETRVSSFYCYTSDRSDLNDRHYNILQLLQLCRVLCIESQDALNAVILVGEAAVLLF